MELLLNPWLWTFVALDILLYVNYKKWIGKAGEFWVKRELKKYYSVKSIKYIDTLFWKRYNLHIEVITMQIRKDSEKRNVSERRIRKLIQDGRIEGAEKIGTTWNIPDDTYKPIDKRLKDEIKFKIDLSENSFKEVDYKLVRLNIKRLFYLKKAT